MRKISREDVVELSAVVVKELRYVLREGYGSNKKLPAHVKRKMRELHVELSADSPHKRVIVPKQWIRLALQLFGWLLEYKTDIKHLFATLRG